VRSLVNGGSEVNVLRSDVISQLSLESIGEVTFKGIVGSPISAPLVRLRVQKADEAMSENDYITVILAYVQK